MSNYGKSNSKCHQNAQKGRPRAPKAHQKGTKLMAKHAKISQNGAPGVKVWILNGSLSDLGSHFGSIFYPKSDKMVQKSLSGIDVGKVLTICRKFVEKSF